MGDPGGAPLLLLHRPPGSRLLQPTVDSNDRLSVVTYNRPGYGLSTPSPRRIVADVAEDIAAVADALGWQRFAVAGVSAGGPHALAAAALLPGRVTRCAPIVTTAPFGATGLDFYAGMDDESGHSWRRAVQGGSALEQEYAETATWVDQGLPGLDLEDAEKAMLLDAFQETLRQGSAGFLEDSHALVSDGGFSLADVRVPTRIMQLRPRTTIWLSVLARHRLG